MLMPWRPPSGIFLVAHTRRPAGISSERRKKKHRHPITHTNGQESQYSKNKIYIHTCISKASRDKYIPTKNQYLANNIIKHLKVCDDIQ